MTSLILTTKDLPKTHHYPEKLRERFAILKPDKGSGVVLINYTDYLTNMTSLFSDPSKFKKLDKDPSLTQLASPQNYLREIHKHNEIDDATYTYIYNIHTRTQTDETQTGR